MSIFSRIFGRSKSKQQRLYEEIPDPVERDKAFLHGLVQDMLKDSARDRRMRTAIGLVRASFILIAVVIAFGLSNKPLPWEGKQNVGSHTAIVSLEGMISDKSTASADKLNPVLRKAFANENSKGVILKINSPGGSAVQSGRIYDEILELKKQYNKPIYAVIDDIGASGGYYIAAAADKIFANRASLVGSIGVITSGFGFTELMDKIGVERRVITSGTNKDLLDPFAPLSSDVQTFWESVLKRTHEQFIARVKEGRGDRLKPEGEDLFNGLIWNGEQAKELGLIDDLSTPEQVARDVVGEEKMVDYEVRSDLFSRLSSRASVMARSFMEEMVNVYVR